LKSSDLASDVGQEIPDEVKKVKKQDVISKSEIVVGILPGIGDYNSDTSSDEDTDDSEDDTENSIINDNSVNSALFNKYSPADKSATGKIANR
jgi:hypothetical protein